MANKINPALVRLQDGIVGLMYRHQLLFAEGR
jgi:hypothetical protein